MYWHTVYFMRLRVTEMTDHSLRMKGNVASDITRGSLSSGDEDGTPYAQDSPLTASWLLSKQQKNFCRIPPIYEPLVNLAVNGFCRTFKGWTHTGRARLFRDAPNLLTSHKDIKSQPKPIEGNNTSARTWPDKIPDWCSDDTPVIQKRILVTDCRINP